MGIKKAPVWKTALLLAMQKIESQCFENSTHLTNLLFWNRYYDVDCLAKYGYNGNARKTLENMKLMFLQSFGHILKNINQTNTDCINLHHFQWRRKTTPMQESYRNNIFPAMYIHQDIFISRTQQSVVVSYIFSSVPTNIFSSHFSKTLFLKAMQGSCN